MEPDGDYRFRVVLRSATDRLRSCLADAPAGSGGTPYLDALVLLAHATSMSTERIFAALEDQVPARALRTFDRLLARRCNGEPVSYIRGMKEFYGRQFEVGAGVLVPRPDTETLVECVLETLGDLNRPNAHVHDCCTGSGCVGITVGLEASCRVTGSDISETATGYALRNADNLGLATMEVWQGDLLDPLRRQLQRGSVTPPEIIAANPPYVTDNEVANLTSRGWPEPSIALSGGSDGLDLIRRLVRDAPACLAEGGWLMVEIGSDQGEAVSRLFVSAGYSDMALVRDLAGHFRVCKARWYRA